jgi:ABC-type branched-subunit amino acid transport system substrate-binding protein
MQQDNIAAIIGEYKDDTTLTMATVAAVNNVLHCTDNAGTPLLSKKANYPMTIRTMTVATYQAHPILQLVTTFNITTIAIVTSNDDLGSGYVQALNAISLSYNVKIGLVVTYELDSEDSIKAALQSVMSAQIQTIVVSVFGIAPKIFKTAQKLDMLNGNYWYWYFYS